MRIHSALVLRLISFRTALCFAGPLLLAGLAGAQRDSDFMRSFREAMSAGDRDLQAELIDENVDAAVWAAVETCELIASAASAELEEDIDALGKAWRKAKDTRFVLKQYEYFSLLRPAYKRARTDLKKRYVGVRSQYDAALEAEETRKLGAYGLDFEGLSDAFQELGDFFMAAVCAEAYGECFGEELLGDKADLQRSCEGFGLVIEYREKLGLDGEHLKTAKAIFEDLEYRGFGAPEKGPEARARERMKEDSSLRPRPMNATFRLVNGFGEIRRPNYASDSVYQSWQTIDLRKTGSTAPIHTLLDSPQLVREAASQVSVDLNGDSKGDLEVPVNGSMRPVLLEVSAGEIKREWAFLAVTGSDRDTFQGVQPFNLAPSDFGVSIYIAPAASVVGMIGETEIQIFDDNMDGRYGSPPVYWALAGLRGKDSQPDVDSIRIGKSKVAIPWSELVKVGADWYRFESNEAGTDIIYSRTEIETGKIKLSMKGPKADFMILQGSGKNSGVMIDIASVKAGIEAPVGSYQLLVGRVSKGKRAQLMKALVLPPKNSRRWSVKAGKTTTVELGSPFGFDFSFDQDGEFAHLKGADIVVTGRSDETYQRLWNCRIQPEVTLRKAGSKRGGKPTKMRIAGTQDEVFADGFEVIWRPYDIQVAKKKSGEDVEVQLAQKKNRLFGKIQSEWKGE